MTNDDHTPDETPQNPYGQQPPPGEPGYGPPGDPYGQPYGGGADQPPYGQSPYGGTGGTGGPPQFSVGGAFGYGWKKVQANLGPILMVALVMFAVLVTIQILQFLLTGGSDTSFELDPSTGRVEDTSSGVLGASILASLVFGALSFLAQLVIQSGIVKGSLDLTRGRPISVGSMFSGINWAQVIVAALILAVATMVGILLCVLPGLVVMFLTTFTLYFVIDKDLPAVEAIKASVSLTIANAGVLIVFFLACIAAYIAGALLCGVGLLVAIPVVVLAQAYAYRTLQGEQVDA